MLLHDMMFNLKKLTEHVNMYETKMKLPFSFHHYYLTIIDTDTYETERI